MKTIYQGIAHVYGDNVDTDRIIAGKYTKTLDRDALAKHALEDLDPGFVQRVKAGDILVAGSNFGCGSSREQAPLALLASGIKVVVAKSFARIFFRNAINIGLAVIEVDAGDSVVGDTVSVDLTTGTYHNHTRSFTCLGAPLPETMQQILSVGGLIPYLKAEGGFREG